MGEEDGEAVKSKGLETGFSHSSEDLFASLFRFLKALAKDNIQVQRRCVVMFPMPICSPKKYSNVHVTVHIYVVR